MPCLYYYYYFLLNYFVIIIVYFNNCLHYWDFICPYFPGYGNFRFLLYCVIPGTIIKEHEVKYILIWMFMNLRTNKRKCSAILIWICGMYVNVNYCCCFNIWL